MSLEEHNITVGQQMVSSCAGKQHQHLWQISVDAQKMIFWCLCVPNFAFLKRLLYQTIFLVD